MRGVDLRAAAKQLLEALLYVEISPDGESSRKRLLRVVRELSNAGLITLKATPGSYAVRHSFRGRPSGGPIFFSGFLAGEITFTSRRLAKTCRDQYVAKNAHERPDDVQILQIVAV